MVNIIIYGILSLICAGILYYYMSYDDDPLAEDISFSEDISFLEDISSLAIYILCGLVWPIIILGFVFMIIVRFAGVFIKQIAKICAFIHGFIHSIRRKDD